MGQSYCTVYPRDVKLSDIDFVSMKHELDSYSLKDELWKDIPGYEGRYQASTLGRIRSLPRYVHDTKGRVQVQKGCILHQYGDLYKKVILRKDNCSKNMPVHRLIANTFIPNYKNKETVDHIDKDPSNNKASNLRWATYKEQSNYSSRSIPVMCIEDNIIFNSYREAGMYYQVYPQYIGKCVRTGKSCHRIHKHFKKA